jgi:hypothetical protein
MGGILRSMRRWPLLLFALLWIAQGIAATPPVPTPPAGSLPEMKSRARHLGPTVLVAEAVDHEGLRRVLDRGRYVAGSEREFFGRAVLYNHVTERVLRFDREAGASSYLRWLRVHAADVLGEPQSLSASPIGNEGFVYRPRGCGCPSERPTFLIAWRRGRDVLTVLASGNGATAQTTGGLARRLDRITS